MQGHVWFGLVSSAKLGGVLYVNGSFSGRSKQVHGVYNQTVQKSYLASFQGCKIVLLQCPEKILLIHSRFAHCSSRWTFGLLL